MHGASIPFPDYSFYTTPDLINAFALGPERYRAAIAGLNGDELRARPRGPERWSIHEIIIHTADSELQGAFRVRKTFAEPGSLWPVHDQNVWSRTIGYQTEPDSARERALTLFGLVREQSLSIFLRAVTSDWEKSGSHPEFGVMNLRKLLELYADHGERHIDQILESRRLLGRPIDLEPLLPRRLF